jgi:alanine-glyoxylate transaminase/serine-glyoxylate transaminase/serine-pyruvate transaminase
MQNYEAKKPSYFATPSPQLIRALHTALTQILQKPLAERFARHAEVSDKIKQAVANLGLKLVATKPEDQAHAMTAIYLPETVKAAELLPVLARKGVVFAGGIHKEIAPKYIRFGHMGVSVVSRCPFRAPHAGRKIHQSLAKYDCRPTPTGRRSITRSRRWRRGLRIWVIKRHRTATEGRERVNRNDMPRIWPCANV